MGHLYLAVDPGKSTGMVAIYSELDQIRVIGKHTTRSTNLGQKWVQQYYRNHPWGNPVTLILELPPERKPGAHKVYPLFTEWKKFFSAWTDTNPSCDLKVIGPGQWKPFAKAQRWRKPKGFTQHEYDALSMVRYVMIVQLRRKKGAVGKLPSQLLKEFIKDATEKTG